MWSTAGTSTDPHRDRVDKLSRVWSNATTNIHSGAAAALAPPQNPRHSSQQQSASSASSSSSANTHHRILVGHKKPVDGIAWNASGTRLATVSRDTTVRVWSFDARQPLNTQAMDCLELRGHTSDVERCVWNPKNNDQLATCSADRSIKLWDTRTGKLLHSLATIGENLVITWSPSGDYIAFCNNNNMLSLVQIDPKSPSSKPHVLKSVAFPMDINAIEFDANSERLLLGYQRGTIEVLSVPSLATQTSIPCHSTTIFTCTFDPKYQYLATGSADSTVNLFSTRDLVCQRSFTRLDDTIRTISFSHDSQLLAYGGKDHRIEIADVASGARVCLFETKDEVLSCAFHPHSMILAYTLAAKDTSTQGGQNQQQQAMNRMKNQPGEIYLLVANTPVNQVRPVVAATSSMNSAVAPSPSSSSSSSASSSTHVKKEEPTTKSSASSSSHGATSSSSHSHHNKKHQQHDTSAPMQTG